MDAKVAYLHEQVNNRPALSDNPNNVGYTLMGLAPNIDINWLKAYKDPVNGNYINWNNNVYQVNPYWAINEQPNNSIQDRLNGFVQLKYQLLPFLFSAGAPSAAYTSGCLLISSVVATSVGDSISGKAEPAGLASRRISSVWKRGM